ncbi:MAG: DUF3857 domain-containing protein [Reichenbachiella sp.]
MRTFLFTILLFGSSFLMANNNAIINSASLSIEIKNENNCTITETKNITIINENGYNLVRFHDYYDKYRKIRSLSIIIMDPNGKKVKKYTKNDALDYAFNSSYEINDIRSVFLDPDYKNFPFTIQIETIVDLKGFISLPTWVPMDQFNVDVSYSKMEVTTPIDYGLRIMEEHCTNVKKTESINNDMKTYNWEISQIKGLEKNNDYDEFIDNQTKVYLAPTKFSYGNYNGEMNSWSNFGNWFLDLNKGLNNFSEETKADLDQINDEDSKVIVDQVFKYMQDKTRYISIQLGIGGFQSLSSEFVDTKGYGDCKALTNYMKAMLEYKNIPSNYILVRAGSNANDIKPGFPSTQFNHVFLAVPMETDTVLLECTSQTYPSNYIGTFTDDRDVLWIKKDKSEIIRNRKYNEEDNLIQKKAHLELSSDGNATLDLVSYHDGVYYDNYDIYQSRSKEQVEQYNYSLFSYSDFVINSYETKKALNRASYRSGAKITIHNLAKNTQNKVLLPMNVLQPIDQYVTLDRYKKFSCIKRGFTIKEQVVIETPDKMWLKTVPESISFESKFGSYSMEIERIESSVEVKRKVVIKSGKYSNEEFDAFYEFIHRIKSTDNTKLILQSST